MKFAPIVSAAFALGLMSSAQAQDGMDGLVNVNIQDLLQDIAVDLNIEETNIPVTIQLPISIAANVCDVSIDLLAVQVDTGEANCVAVTGSQEVTQTVIQQMAAGGAAETSPEEGETAEPTDVETEATGTEAPADNAADDSAADPSVDPAADDAADAPIEEEEPAAQ